MRAHISLIVLFVLLVVFRFAKTRQPLV